MTLLKSIVVCLALANAGYFLWAREIAHPQDARAALAPASTLKLASEAPSTEHASGSADVASGTGTGPGAGTGTGTDAGTGAGPGTGAGAGGAGAGPGGGDFGGGAPGALGAGDDTGRGTRADPGTGASTGAGAADSEAPGGALLTNVKRCISVGPFRDVAEAAHAASTLRGGGYDPRQRVAEGEVWAGVWVYVPVNAARGSEPILAKLKAGGIEDALEMPGPNEGSVVSLGLYGDSRRAQGRVAQAQSLGFNPSIADRKRTGDVYWIDIDLKPTDSVLKPSDLQAETGRIVRLEVKACPVAGTQQ